MKKAIKILLSALITCALVIPGESCVFAAQFKGESTSIVRGVSMVQVTATRSTSTKANIAASGPLTATAEKIKTTATLYEYDSSTGVLKATTASPVTKTITNCNYYNFNTTFTVSSAKVYKVKLEITDTTNGKTNKLIVYSNSF